LDPSRYQDAKFKEEHPEFSPISRFGIGVLSAFMVADWVRIVTFNCEESEGRQISLRSVHGKYLIRLLNKKTSEESKRVGPNGTEITLKMRASAKPVDVLKTIQKWIVFPNCELIIRVDDEEPLSVGFASPRDAVQDFVDRVVRSREKSLEVEVIEREKNGIRVAYAMLYNPHFRDRSFLSISETPLEGLDSIPPVGACVEGIRVDLNLPGFEPEGRNRAKRILCIANCCGPNAPHTNVSRSALESDRDRDKLAETLIDICMEQIHEEIKRLQEVEKFSLRHAIDEFPYIYLSISGLGQRGVAEGARLAALRNFPMFLLENQSNQELISALDLRSRGSLWTVESHAIAALMRLLRDSGSEKTAQSLAEFCRFRGETLPAENLVSNANHPRMH